MSSAAAITVLGFENTTFERIRNWVGEVEP